MIVPLRRVAFGLLALLVAFGTSLVVAPKALAHNEIVDSTPKQGAVLAAPPTTVQLVFDQVIDSKFPAVAISVQDGTVLDTAVTVDEKIVNVELQSAAPAADGPLTWTVGYRMLSADGHPVGGVLTFVVDPSAAPGVGSSAAPGSSASESGGSAGPSSPITESAPVTAEPAAAVTATVTSAEVAAAVDDSGPGLLSSVWFWLVLVLLVGGVAVVLLRRRATGNPR